MGLSIVLGLLVSIIGSVVNESPIMSTIKSHIFGAFSSGGFAGLGIEGVISLVMGIVEKVLGDKQKIEVIKLQILEAVIQGKFQEYQIDSSDRSSARQMETNLTKINNKKPWEVDFLTIGIVLIFTSFLGFLSFEYLIQGDQALAGLFNQAFSALIIAFTTAIAFWLGSNSQKPLVDALQQSIPSIEHRTGRFFHRTEDVFDQKANTIISKVEAEL